MSRLVSFVVLVAVLLVMAAMFYKVMASFILPLFLATMLAVIFKPLHAWFLTVVGNRIRVAAGLTVVAVVLFVLVPILLILSFAAVEIGHMSASNTIRFESPRAEEVASVEPSEPEDGRLVEFGRHLSAWLVNEWIIPTSHTLGLSVSPETVKEELKERVPGWLAPSAMFLAKLSGRILLGAAVMLIGLYYFLADGPWMIQRVMQLSPLDDAYEQELIDQFVRMTRAVVLATFLSAIVQGALAGLGYAVAGVSMVFLLMVLTLFLAMVPFVGAAAVWIPVSLWLIFVEQRPLAGILLGVYGAGIISLADNLIKPMVLHGYSSLHPLLALLSVLGGVKALGPIGIFVGPMVVAFLHTVLIMFHAELGRFATEGKTPPLEPEGEEVEAASNPEVEVETKPRAKASQQEHGGNQRASKSKRSRRRRKR